MQPPNTPHERLAFWSEQVSSFRQSGESMVKFAASRGYTSCRLKYWVDKLGKPQPPRSPKFIELRAADKPRGVLIKLPGGTTLCVDAAIDLSSVVAITRSDA
jgi:hypothetical protein